MVKKEKRYFYLGIFFLLVQTLAIVRNIASGYIRFYWYCDFASGIFALLFFLKKDQAIKGLLSIGLFAQFFYVLILVYESITGIPLFGFVLEDSSFLIILASGIIHLSTLFVFIVEYKIKPKKISLFYSLIFLLAIYFVVLSFTDPDRSIAGNYNYIYFSKIFSPYIKNYSLLWVPLTFTLVVLPTYFFQYLVYKLFLNKKKLKINLMTKKSIHSNRDSGIIRPLHK